MNRLARRALFALFLCGAGAYAVAQFRSDDGWRGVWKKHEHIQQLRAEIKTANARNTELSRRIKALDKKDEIEKEQHLIDRLRKGEMQFHVEEPKVEPPAPAVE